MNIEKVLSRFKNVKSTGKRRWTCKCSAHDDKSPSMHIMITDDDRVLINCKAGCAVYDILMASGLGWADVMPENKTSHHVKPIKKVLYDSEALELIRFESQIIMACAFKMKKGELNHNDLDRADKAMQTINRCYQ